MPPFVSVIYFTEKPKLYKLNNLYYDCILKTVTLVFVWIPNAIVNVGKWSVRKETLWGMIKVCNERGFKDFNATLLVYFIYFRVIITRPCFSLVHLMNVYYRKIQSPKWQTLTYCVSKIPHRNKKTASPLEDILGKSGVILLSLFKSVYITLYQRVQSH